MAIAVGQKRIDSNAAGGNVTTTGVATQAAGSVFVIGAVYDSGTFTSLGDNKGNTYTQIGSEVAIGSGAARGRWYYVQNGVGGSGHTVSLASSGTNGAAWIIELTGAALTAALSTNNQVEDASSPFASPSITPAAVNGMLLAFHVGISTSNPATHAETGLGSSTIQVDQTNGATIWPMAVATAIKSPASGSYASSWTETGGSDCAEYIAFFREASSGGSRAPDAPITLNPGGVPMGLSALAPGKSQGLGPVRWQTWESYPWSAAPAASIDIAAAGLLTITGAASLTAIGTVAAAGTLTITGAALLRATGTVASAGTLVITATAALTSIGTLASAGTLVINGAASLTAQGTLTALGTLVINGAAALTGLGSLASAGTAVINGAANLTSDSANDLASAGSIVITSAAALSAIGSLASSGLLTITGAARLDDGAVVVTAEQNSGGWPIFATLYEQELSRRRKERQRQAELEDETEQIPEEISREIASLLHEQEAKTAKRQELERLRDLAQTLGAEEAERQLGQRVAAALTRAVERGNYSALEALDREIARAQSEEDDWLLAVTMILADD